MRRGAATTSRALAEQTVAGDQISRAAVELQQMVSTVTKAMTEQTSGMKEIAAAADGIRVQTEQTARALVDQSRVMRDMTDQAQSTTRQIKLITKANIDHSQAADSLLTSVAEIRRITDRNAAGVKQTRGGTDDLLKRAQALTAIVERPSHARGGNGRPSRSHR